MIWLSSNAYFHDPSLYTDLQSNRGGFRTHIKKIGK